MNGIIIAVLVFIVLVALVLVWMKVVTSCRKRRAERKREGSKRKVRVVYISQNAILLCPRDEEAARCGDDLDVPLEAVLDWNETVEHGLARLLCPLYPESLPDVRFCMKHLSKCDGEDWEVYLFAVWCDNAEIPSSVCMNYKLWTRRQIEANMGKGVFSRAFEEEYPHLRLVVDVWAMANEDEEKD